LRNLRNFEEAGVSRATLDQVGARIADPDEVGRSRQLPIRFYSAWAATDSVRFGPALEAALDASLAPGPAPPGRAPGLGDGSGPMRGRWSARSRVSWWQVAALFGTALARRAEHADVFAYSEASKAIRVRRSASVLRTIPKFMGWTGAGGGTLTLDVLARRY